MKTRYFLLLAATVLLASCQKEFQTPEIVISKGVTTLEVGLPDTKTYLGDAVEGTHKVYWSNDDQIAVNGTASNALAELPENAGSATFTINGIVNTPFNIVYPASIYTDATHVTLPSVQTYKAGGFADGMFPMAGYSASGASIQLRHLCAIVKISVKRETAEHAEARSGEVDTDKIVSVRFSGNNSEKVSGEFELDYSTPALTAASGTGDDLVVSVAKSQSTSTSTAKDYYLVVPARTYSNGFTVTVKDANGHIMTKSKGSSWTPEAGKLYNMTAFEFVPTSTELGIEISNAAQLIAFARAYNNHEFDSLGDDVLVATLTDNISFVNSDDPDVAGSWAAFNATGGIGKKKNLFGANEDYYFNGIFNGGGYTISGLEATVPLFAAIGGAGHVSDFTIDSSCSFTFTHPDTAELNAGAVVGYHKGELKDVEVEADVALVAGEVSQATCLGGIAGRITEGVVDNCSYSGAITVPAGFQSAAKKIQMGGIVGWISNGSGKVQNSDFEGTIDNQGQLIAASETSDFKNNPQLMIGGIAGLNSGTLDNCSVANHATGITVTPAEGKNYTGTIVTHSANAYHYAIAGIAGRNDGTINGCTNNASIVNIFSADRGTSGNMNGRYLNAGGIVGYNSSTISGSNNYGSIIDRANPKVHYVGGIAGRNVGGTISNSDNNSTGTIGVGTSHVSPYGARMLYVGGITASNESGTVSNIHNSGNITVSRMENTGGVLARVGGVIGENNAAIDGSALAGTITNLGNISQSSGNEMCSTPTADNDYGFFFGGITGYTTAGVKNVSNSGNVGYTCTATGVGAQYVYLGGIAGKVLAASAVDVEKCTNSGKVTFTATASYSENNATRYYYNYLGGIVGYAKNANIKGDSSNKCTNSAQVKGGDGSSNNNQGTPSFMIGGIVGYITGDSSIEYCDLTGSGNPYNDHWSNRGIGSYDCPAVGGIAGQIFGADGAEIPVSNCAVASTASINARRGAVGGIVGLAQYAEISDCTVPIIFQTTQSGYFYGGIVAAAQNSTISNCTYSGATIRSSQMQIGGGIVGQLDSGSTVDSCSSSATDISKNGTAVTTTGGIAGKSVAGTTISNCHYTATIGKICGDTNFIDGGGNAADL